MSNTILVVDADAEELVTYVDSLHDAGFTVERARGEEAIAILHDRAPQVAVVDLGLSRDLIARLRVLRAELPIIALGLTNDLAVTALEMGAMHFILKPVAGRVLARMVALAIREWSARAMRGRVQPRPQALAVSSTDAKNEFASLLDTAVSRGPVRIDKHQVPRAVLIAWDEYEKLTTVRGSLGALSEQYDTMLYRMQHTDMREQHQAAFDASPEELAAAALAQSRHGR